MKRLLCLLLVLCFMPAISVSAVQNYRVELSAPEQVNCGEDISLRFSITSIPAEGLCGMDFEIGFDGELVAIADVSLTGFPQEGNWCYSGRIVNDKYFLFVYDNYNETAGTPCSVYGGSDVTVTVRFKAKMGVEGTALFTVGSYGSVTGTSFTEEGPVSVYGLGASNKSVLITYDPVGDRREELWYTKNGVMYVLPYTTAAQLADAGVLYDKDSEVKAEEAFAAMGDSFGFSDGTVAADIMIALDVNGDGHFNTADYLLMRKYLCGQTVLTETAYYAADISGDGTVSTVDLAIARDLLKTGTVL
ncbi:MAG: hypothetical protein E7597_02420 [Ruminococcaceae bacterium]|nr:hypothetical protein [Oscillospiraceae bacterium]